MLIYSRRDRDGEVTQDVGFLNEAELLGANSTEINTILFVI